ncbi:GNAT family N-acetyltransferase [Nonomuraea sp. NPDC059023]|uniref:GNAT family N-acetyltransferase n=1 Tax=unclassified Nonomuraea TaxID=2593643 RepID=UPI00368B4056
MSGARPRVGLVAAGEIARHLTSVADVGGRSFTRAPWHEPYAAARSVAARLLSDSARPGFVLALALGGDEDEEVYGFAYGYSCSSLAVLAGRVAGDDFTLKELAVLPERCGMRYGAALHDTIVAAAGVRPKWLSTHPHARAALGLYRSRGWQVVGRPRTERVVM